MLRSPYWLLIPSSSGTWDTRFAITEQAADLRVRYQLAVPEAIQLATALVDGAGAFVGNSPRLRSVRELDVILLQDLREGASTPSTPRA